MRRPGIRLELLAAGAVALVVFGVYLFGPWLTGERGIVAATPAGFPRGEPGELKLPPGKTACLGPIGIPEDAQRAVFIARGRPGSTVQLVLDGPGYRSAARVAVTAEREHVAGAITPPRDDVLGRACWRNPGPRSVWLIGGGEIRGAPLESATTLDGQTQPLDVGLRLDQAEPKSLLAHASDGFARLALWKPGIVGVPVLWLVALLVALAVPAAVLWAFASSVRSFDGD